MTVLRYKVIDDLKGLQFEADELGLIKDFGVMVNLLPVAFWNNFSTRIVQATPTERISDVEQSLVEMSQESAYHTWHRLLTSDRFRQIVDPTNTEGAIDTLTGAFAACAALGIADAEITRHKPDVIMAVRVIDTFEAEQPPGVRRGLNLKSYAFCGLCAALMDLVYGAPYPKGLNTFQCRQIPSLSLDDPFSNFVVSKRPRINGPTDSPKDTYWAQIPTAPYPKPDK